MSTSSPTTDTIDLADIGRSLLRGWRWVIGGLVAGGVVALLILAVVPRRFDAAASAIIRSSPEAGGSLLSRLGESGGGGAAALLGGGMSTPIETDIQILSSRAVAGAVVDSLLLQVEVGSAAVPANALVASLRAPGAFKRVKIEFERTAPAVYRYASGALEGTARPGGQIRLPVGSLTLRESLPEKFALRLYDREEAIRRTSKRLNVGKLGGEVVRVSYRAADSLTAAAVPNALLVDYLARRKTDDRGVNAHRVEFLYAQLDSNAVLLSNAEDALRRFQERSGLVDAQVMGKLELENAAELRKNLGALEVEGSALEQLLAQVASGRMTARQLIAYPSFLKSPGINDLLRQLAELETERTKLLDRRLDTDDEVVALSRSIASIEGQLVPLARAYATSLERQRAGLASQVGTVAAALSAFPGAAQTSLRLTRDVLRLNQLSLALTSQLVQARLSAVSEGGDVRALDRATPPRKVAFPEPWLTSGLGLGVGLLFGLGAALVVGAHGRYLEGAGAIERVLGVPAIRFRPGSPLLMSGRETARTLLLVPIDASASTAAVAARLAETASARGAHVTVIDLSDPGATIRNTAEGNAEISRAEAAASFVVVRVPGLSSDSTAAVLSHDRPVLLVASAGKVRRRVLTGAIDTLRRLDVPCAGVVLSDMPTHAALAG